MKIDNTLLAVVVSLLLLSPWALAEPINPTFSAVCKESSARTYSASIDFEGMKNRDSWTKKGTADPEEWEFRYKGGNRLEVNEKEIPIIEQHKGVLIALSHGSSGVGSTAWLYAVHLGLDRIVASVVNAYGHMDGKFSGILTTSIELSCDFDTN